MANLIDRVETYAIRVPLAVTYVGSTYAVSERWTVVTEIGSEDGAIGRVYNGDPRDDALEIASIIREKLAPIVIGTDPLRIGQTWPQMFQESLQAGTKKPFMMAVAALDCAIWDLRGRMLGTNITELLGGSRQGIPTIAIAGYYGEGKSLEDLQNEMAQLKADGIKGCKIKVGGLPPDEDAARAAAARAGGGADFALSVDANRGWTIAEAARFADRVQDLDLAWFEEPCHWYDDAEAMGTLARKTTIPICAGQNEITSRGVHRMLLQGGVEIVNFDASEGGGVSEWLRSTAISTIMGCQVGHHEEPQIAMHLLSSIPNSTYVECFPDEQRDPIWAHMLTSGPRITDGIMWPSNGHGFGLEFDPHFVAKYRVSV